MPTQQCDISSAGEAAPLEAGTQPACRTTSWKHLVGALMLLALLPWFLYGHTLNFEVVLDDVPYIFNNPLLKDAQSFLYPLYFKSFAMSADNWGISPDVPLNFILRPVAYLTFFINLNLGGEETAGFRLVNISIHMLNGMLLFLLARTLLGRNDRRSFAAGLASALVFAAHPLATESVTYIVQRFESLSTLFFFTALLSYLNAKKAASTFAGRAWMTGSVVSTLLAMLTKETGVTLPVLLLLMEMLWQRQTLMRSLMAVRWHLLLMPMTPLMVFAAEWAQSGSFSVVESLNITNGGPTTYPVTHYFLTQVCAWVSYLRLLIFPAGQNFDHDYPLITSITDGRLLLSSTVVLGLLIAAGLFFRRRGGASGALMLWGVLWYFITLAPSSSIVPLPDLFSEHRSYLPSIGIFLVLAVLVDELQALRLTAATRFTLVATGSTCVLAMSFATLLRNESYRTRESIWKDALAKGSDRARVWKGLGIAAYNAGRYEEAVSHFKHSTESHPQDIESWINLCAMYVQLKRSGEGLVAARVAVRNVGGKVALLHLMAHSMIQEGRWQEAQGVWEDILKALPDHRDSHLCLAEICSQTGDTQRALRHLHAAERLKRLEPNYLELKQRMQSQIASLP